MGYLSMIRTPIASELNVKVPRSVLPVEYSARDSCQWCLGHGCVGQVMAREPDGIFLSLSRLVRGDSACDEMKMMVVFHRCFVRGMPAQKSITRKIDVYF